jgi:hypothetical protein
MLLWRIAKLMPIITCIYTPKNSICVPNNSLAQLPTHPNCLHSIWQSARGNGCLYNVYAVADWRLQTPTVWRISGQVKVVGVWNVQSSSRSSRKRFARVLNPCRGLELQVECLWRETWLEFLWSPTLGVGMMSAASSQGRSLFYHAHWNISALESCCMLELRLCCN